MSMGTTIKKDDAREGCQMTLIERHQKECQRARQKFKDTGSKYHEGYADAFDIAEQTSINI